MPTTLLAIPNVSEGRDREAIEAIGAAFDARLLGIHSDPDHHRSVFTLAGAPGALAGAVLRGAAEAVSRTFAREAALLAGRRGEQSAMLTRFAARMTRAFAHDGIVVSVDAPGADLAWLEEFVGPAFTVVEPGPGAVRVSFEAAAGYPVDGQSTGDRAAFTLDSGSIRLAESPIVPAGQATRA